MTSALGESRVPPRRAGRVAGAMLVLVALVLLAAGARMLVGWSAWGWPQGELAGLVIRSRGFLVAIAAVVGAALALSGVSLQALLRNSLAEPYILGLSTGAAVGLMAQALAQRYWHVSLGAGHVGAAAGAAASMLIVFSASRRHGVLDPLGLLLTGVVLSSINGAMILLLNYIVGPGGIRDDLAQWMMGYLNEGVRTSTLIVVAVVTVAGLAGLLAAAPAIDIATLSETEARSLGIHLPRLRVLLFLTASLLTAGAVLLAGPIAFVGLIGPHIARLLVGPSHLLLLPAAALAGAAVVLTADLISATLASLWPGMGVLPVGIFTALVGGPAFLWLLHPHLGRGHVDL